MTRAIASNGPLTRFLASDLSLRLAVAAFALFCVGIFAFLGLYPETGTGTGFTAFDGAMQVDKYIHRAPMLSKDIDRQGVKFILRRAGEYRSFPKDSYEVKIFVPNAVSPPQPLALSGGDEDTEYWVDLDFQWADGSLAQKEQRVPESVKIELTRKSDGAHMVKELDLLRPGVGGMFR